MMNPDQSEIYDGRIFTGAQAVQLHMIDSLGYLDEAIRTAGGMAGLGEPRAVMYRRCNDRARSIYSVTPNTPLQGQIMQMNLPAPTAPVCPRSCTCGSRSQRWSGWGGDKVKNGMLSGAWRPFCRALSSAV